MIEVHGTAKTPPAWFVKELARIDDRYKIFYIEDYDYWSIRLITPYYYEKEGRLVREEKMTCLATFKSLNDRALEDIRRRKRLGEAFARMSDVDADKAYLDWVVAMNREARQKEREIAIEMQAEGWVEIDKYANRGKHSISGPPGV